MTKDCLERIAQSLDEIDKMLMHGVPSAQQMIYQLDHRKNLLAAMQLARHNIPQEAKRVRHIYPHHAWKKDAQGKPDEYAWDNDHHAGVSCTRCFDCECVWCKLDYMSEGPCEVDHYICPACGVEYVMSRPMICECGQHLLYPEEPATVIYYEEQAGMEVPVREEPYTPAVE